MSVFIAITHLVSIQSYITGLINPFQVKNRFFLFVFFILENSCDDTNSAHEMCINCLPDSDTGILISALHI